MCKSWYTSANDDMLWKRLFLSCYKLPRTTQIANFGLSWKSEFERLLDKAPCEEMQELSDHKDEVLHVKFSHDGSELVSCSKDRTFMVWTDETDKDDGKFHCCYANDMSKYEWRHTWAAQFCPNDSKLMVSGVVSDIRGEIAIFDTGRYSESRPSRKSNQHGLYKILNRVVNDPYDMLGCWCSDRFFLSATFDFQPSEIASIWLCRPHNEADASAHLSLISPTKVIFKFRNPANRAIYARFLQLHPRSQFKGESNYWSDQGGQELSNAPSSDDEFPSVDLPFATGEMADKSNNFENATKDIFDEEMCIIFICSDRTFIPHQVGFQRIQPSSMTNEAVIRNGAEKVIDLHGHIVGIAISPDYKELYVNVRSWPENCIPTMDNSPAIANQIEMKIIDLETFTIKKQSLMGHVGFTPSEKAFYLYLDVSAYFVGSGSEDKKGCVWDRHYQCIVAKLPHTDCVNCVAFRPSDTSTCATASDDFSIKIWHSRKANRKRNNATCH